MSEAAAAVCTRCGTFLPAGATGLCIGCQARGASETQLRATARLMSLCLAVAGLLVAAPGLYALFRVPLRDVPQMLAATLEMGGALWGGAGLVALRRSPVPGWVGIGLTLLCPFNWLMALSNPKAEVLIALGVVGELLAVGLGVKLWRQRRALVPAPAKA